MTSRACSSCNTSLARSEYSKNQWSKGPAAKCKGCVAGKNNNAPPAPTSKIEEKEVKTPVVDNKAEEEAEKKKKDEE